VPLYLTQGSDVTYLYRERIYVNKVQWLSLPSLLRRGVRMGPARVELTQVGNSPKEHLTLSATCENQTVRLLSSAEQEWI